MKLSRRKMFASIGFLPIAMLPAAGKREEEAVPKIVQNVTVQGSVISQRQLRDEIIEVVKHAQRVGLLNSKLGSLSIQ